MASSWRQQNFDWGSFPILWENMKIGKFPTNVHLLLYLDIYNFLLINMIAVNRHVQSALLKSHEFNGVFK